MNSRQSGWALLEVMVAVVLLAVLVGGLLSAALSTRSLGSAAVERAVGLGGPSSAAADPWAWGGPTLRAWWTPGPTLVVGARTPGADSGLAVGLWVDGWFVSEKEPDEDGCVRIGASMWAERMGQEVVVRVRLKSAVWSVPWRMVVPPATGLVAASAEGSRGVDAAPGELDVAGAVVHPAALGSLAPDPAVTSGVVSTGRSGLPFAVALIPPGTAKVRWAGLDQYWVSEQGRSLDVYF
jgi:hypothetical protein